MSPDEPTNNRTTMTYDDSGPSWRKPVMPVSYPVNIIYDPAPPKPKEEEKGQEDDKGQVA